MKTKKDKLRIVVLTWTLLTSVFLWTTTMRILFKPEISAWSFLSVGGKGFSGAFWLPPLVALFTLFIFYLEGRGRYRNLFHGLLVGWHLLLSAIVLIGSTDEYAKVQFGTWGVTMSLIWLIVPFGIFLLLIIWFVIRERKGKYEIPVYDWGMFNRKPFWIALAIFPVMILMFQLGTGFNWIVKIAVVLAILQWILFEETVTRPYSSQTFDLSTSDEAQKAYD